jgi:hypothetical protein
MSLRTASGSNLMAVMVVLLLLFVCVCSSVLCARRRGEQFFNGGKHDGKCSKMQNSLAAEQLVKR